MKHFGCQVLFPEASFFKKNPTKPNQNSWKAAGVFSPQSDVPTRRGHRWRRGRSPRWPHASSRPHGARRAPLRPSATCGDRFGPPRAPAPLEALTDAAAARGPVPRSAARPAEPPAVGSLPPGQRGAAPSQRGPAPAASPHRAGPHRRRRHLPPHRRRSRRLSALPLTGGARPPPPHTRARPRRRSAPPAPQRRELKFLPPGTCRRPPARPRPGFMAGGDRGCRSGARWERREGGGAAPRPPPAQVAPGRRGARVLHSPAPAPHE